MRYFNDAVYVLNSDDPALNLQNFITLLTQLGYSQSKCNDVLETLNKNKVKYNPETNMLISPLDERWGTIGTSAFHAIDDAIYFQKPIVYVQYFDKPNLIDEAWYQYFNQPNENNGTHAIQVVIDDANNVDIRQFPRSTAINFAEINDPYNFKEYETDLLNEFTKNVDSYDLTGNMSASLLAGAMLTIPDFAWILNNLKKTNKWEQMFLTEDKINNLVRFFTSDKADDVQKALYIWNLQDADDNGNYLLNYGWTQLFNEWNKEFMENETFDKVDPKAESLSPELRDIYERGFKFMQSVDWAKVEF